MKYKEQTREAELHRRIMTAKEDFEICQHLTSGEWRNWTKTRQDALMKEAAQRIKERRDRTTRST
jgi:hypothetical protein